MDESGTIGKAHHTCVFLIWCVCEGTNTSAIACLFHPDLSRNCGMCPVQQI